MVAIRRAFLLALTIFCALAVAVPLPLLDQKDIQHRNAAIVFLRSRHAVHGAFEPVESYSHLLGGHRDGEEDAWAFAHQPGNGPVHMTMDGKEKNFYVTTKIPSTSQLGRKWNLSWRDNPRDAYALWHIHRKGHKLLRLDRWPVGGNTPQEYTLQSILERVR